MITIAVDAMGGDHAPRPEVEGAVQAARELGVRILLVGLAPELKKELAPPVEFEHPALARHVLHPRPQDGVHGLHPSHLRLW